MLVVGSHFGSNRSLDRHICTSSQPVSSGVQNPTTTMSDTIITTQIVVGGIPVEVHNHRNGINSRLPVHALFLLHGRKGSTEDVVPIAKEILEINYAPDVNRNRDLIIVAFASI
jgi:hypothetical protein